MIYAYIYTCMNVADVRPIRSVSIRITCDNRILFLTKCQGYTYFFLLYPIYFLSHSFDYIFASVLNFLFFIFFFFFCVILSVFLHFLSTRFGEMVLRYAVFFSFNLGLHMCYIAKTYPFLYIFLYCFFFSLP